MASRPKSFPTYGPIWREPACLQPLTERADFMSYRNYLIAPPKAFNPPRYVQELLRYRHLSVNLMASDIRSRFRRSRLGVLWAIIQPMVYAMVPHRVPHGAP